MSVPPDFGWGAPTFALSILDGFMNDSFLAFQMLQHYGRRDASGPYHPAIERFTATGSAPYNIEALFQFIIAIWDSRGYTSAIATFRNGEVYTLGQDAFLGMLMSVFYMNRTKVLTDYIENISWTYSPTKRDVVMQIGDGQAEEAPIARIQALVTGAMESYNVLTLAPQS